MINTNTNNDIEKRSSKEVINKPNLEDVKLDNSSSGEGESQEVNIKLHLKDFSIWDVSSAAWKRIEGKYLVSIGSSSEDIKLKQLIDV